MSSDPGFEPLGGATRGATYHGYSAPPGPAPAPAPGPVVAHHRPTPLVVVGAGAAIALALGLGVGLFAQPDLGPESAAKPMAPAPPGAQQGLSIEPGPPQALATAAPPPSGKLEVLPPDMARAAAARALPAAAPAATAPMVVRDVSDVAVEPRPAPQPAPPPRPLDTRIAALDSGCSGAPSLAAQMVCSDPDLGAADRALNQAYRRALRSGAAPPEQLRADQQDWLAIREDAARRSPRALARAYDRRIDELNELADDTPQ